MTAPATKQPERYSDKRLKDHFTAYVLLSEPLQFHTSEILAAVREDYPGLNWTDDLGVDLSFDTSKVSIGTFWSRAEAEPRMMNLLSAPGPCDVDWGDLFHKARFLFPEAEQVVKRHRSWLSISVDSVDQSLAARFDAARRMTCMAAVFAKLPVCEAVYFPNGDTIVKPHKWVEAADSAMKASVPIEQWVTICVNPMPDGKDPMPVSVQTVGVAAFTGYEIFMPLARTHPGEAAKWVVGMAILALERGHVYRDSDTIGIEGESRKIRIRHMPEGMEGAQTDMFVLLHPDSKIDEMKAFGPRSREPAPPGFDNSIRGDENALKNKLYSFFAGGRR